MSEGNSWRPDGWKNPYPENPKPQILPSDWAIYEAGADAMLEALKSGEESQISVLSEMWVHAALEWAERNNGKLVFIPDD